MSCLQNVDLEPSTIENFLPVLICNSCGDYWLSWDHTLVIASIVLLFMRKWVIGLILLVVGGVVSGAVSGKIR
jgi:hypothetical protein